MSYSKCLALIAVLLAAVFLVAASEDAQITADQALKSLMDGNARFIRGAAIHPNQTLERVAEVTAAQHPLAVVVGCSDSRVPPEIVFDQGIGDIFVIRTAGEVMDDAALGSIEYAVEHLNVPLVMVLGHDSCGAVKATIDGGEAPGHLAAIVEAIQPAVDEARAETDEAGVLDAAIDANIRNTLDLINSTSTIISEALAGGEVRLVGARYNLTTGAVVVVE